MFEDRKYAIVDTAAFQREVSAGTILPDVFFSNIMETAYNTIRYSVSGESFVIKSNNLMAMEYLRVKAMELNIPYTEYTHDQIVPVLKTSVWTCSCIHF